MDKQEKIFKAGIKKEAGWLYYVEGSDIKRVSFKKYSFSDEPDVPAEILLKTDIEREPGFLYLLDKDGDIVRFRSTLIKRKSPKSKWKFAEMPDGSISKTLISSIKRKLLLNQNRKNINLCIRIYAIRVLLGRPDEWFAKKVYLFVLIAVMLVIEHLHFLTALIVIIFCLETL